MRSLLLACAIAASWPAAARADCAAEEAPSVGIALRRCEEPGRRWVEVRADLAAADVGARASRPEERGQTVLAWSASVEGAVVAIPGGPFAFPTFEPTGLTVGDGEHWTASRDSPALAVLALDARGASLFVPREQVVPSEPWMREVISGVEVLRDGAPRACSGDGCEPAPRAGLGLSSDGRTLVMIAAEGWSAAHAGVTDAELGALLSGAGAHHGIRTAEGSGSVLWLREEGAVTTPSDGAPREAAAFFALVDRSRGATGQLVGVVERASDTSPLTAARIRVETTDGARVAESGTLTSNAYFAFTLPARDYVVRASLTGYRTSCRVCRVQAGRETWCSQFLAAGEGAERCEAPPRGIDAGPWPLGDAGTDAGVEPPPPAASGCAAAPPHARSAPALVALLALALLALRRRR